MNCEILKNLCIWNKKINEMKYIWNTSGFMDMSLQNECSLSTSFIETESWNTLVNSKNKMAVMASDGPIHSFPWTAPWTWPSKRHHTQSLLGPLFHDPSCSQIPPRARRAFLSSPRSATTCCRLPPCPCTALLFCSLHSLLKLSLWVLDYLCSNFSYPRAIMIPFHFCWITEIWFLNLCVCFYQSLFCLCFFDRNGLQLWRGSSSTSSHQPQTTHVFADSRIWFCVMRFAYALHMHRQNLVPLFYWYIKPFELVIEIVFHTCTTLPCLKINLFKRPFRGSHIERLDNAFVLLIRLIFQNPYFCQMTVWTPGCVVFDSSCLSLCHPASDSKNDFHKRLSGRNRVRLQVITIPQS